MWELDHKEGWALKTDAFKLVQPIQTSPAYGFFSGHVWLRELDYKESWAPKNWCFWTVVLEKTPERPLDSKEIKPVNPKGNQPWMFVGRTDAEAEAPRLWPPDEESWFTGKDSEAGKDWRQEEKEMTEDEMVGWHHWLMDMSLSKLQEIVKDREARQAAVHGVTKRQTWLSYWTKPKPKSAAGNLTNWSRITLYLKVLVQC